MIGRQSVGVGVGDADDGAFIAGVDLVEDVPLLGKHQVDGVADVPFAVMGLTRVGDSDGDLVDSCFDLFARGAVVAVDLDRQLRTDDFHQIGAGEHRLVDTGGDLDDALPIEGRRGLPGAACGQPDWPRRRTKNPRGSWRHSCCSCAQDSPSGLAGRVAFCATASCPWVGCPSISSSLLSAQSRNWVLRREYALIFSGGSTPISSAIPVCGSVGPPFRADRLRQDPPRRGLINDSAGLGFMPQRIAVEGGEFAVKNGLACWAR